MRFATGDLGEACPELLAPTFEFESASGRALLTKRRYLQAGYVSSLRAACPDLRVDVTDARLDDKGRALVTTRYSGTHTGAAWAPAEPLHCLGELPSVKAKGKAWTAGPFGAWVTVENGLVTAAAEGFALDRDDNRYADCGAEAVYRAIAGSSDSKKPLGLAASEIVRRRRSAAVPKPARPALADRVSFAVVSEALDALLAGDDSVLFSDDFVLVGPSFAPANLESALFRTPWLVGTNESNVRFFNWRVDKFGIVRLDARRADGRLEAVSATIDADGLVSRLAVGFRLDNDNVDIWGEVPATWPAYAKALFAGPARGLVAPLDRAVDAVAQQLDAVATAVSPVVQRVESLQDSARSTAQAVKDSADNASAAVAFVAANAGNVSLLVETLKPKPPPRNDVKPPSVQKPRIELPRVSLKTPAVTVPKPTLPAFSGSKKAAPAARPSKAPRPSVQIPKRAAPPKKAPKAPPPKKAAAKAPQLPSFFSAPKPAPAPKAPPKKAVAPASTPKTQPAKPSLSLGFPSLSKPAPPSKEAKPPSLLSRATTPTPKPPPPQQRRQAAARKPPPPPRPAAASVPPALRTAQAAARAKADQKQKDNAARRKAAGRPSPPSSK